MWFIRTMFVPYLSKDSRKAVQGEPLFGMPVTQKSPDIRMSELAVSQSALHVVRHV